MASPKSSAGLKNQTGTGSHAARHRVTILEVPGEGSPKNMSVISGNRVPTAYEAQKAVTDHPVKLPD